MLIFGDPQASNERMVEKISSILEFCPAPQPLDVNYLRSFLDVNMSVLDIGQSLRGHSQVVASMVKEVKTLDINLFSEYPDIQMDLCESLIPSDKFNFDIIFCFSILEHCYQPFVAAENLFRMLKPNSKIVGSVPFLFPHHCPDDLIYQDYFRFTKFSLVTLFPKAYKIRVFPHRGRVGAGLNIISQRYKDFAELNFRGLTRFLNKLDQLRKPEQSSGFTFEVFN